MSLAFEIIFEDADLLVVNKPSGLAVQPDKSGSQSLVELLSANGEAHLVHRLDQRVSGLVVFAKNKSALANLNAQFQHRAITKKYKAVVGNKPPHVSGKLTHWLVKDAKKNLSKAYENEVKNSQIAELSYHLLKSSERYFLLEIELMTGRFHQIRSQLKAIGCPIVGDLKYGYKRSSPDGSIFLQAYLLSFNHPKTNENLTFEIEQPDIWARFGVL